MELKWIDKDKIVRREVNPRVHNIELLEESFKRYGWITPVVVDSKYRLVDGHGRLEVAEGDKVLCVVLDRPVEDDEALDIAAALHRTVGGWQWDNEAMKRIADWFGEEYERELQSQLDYYRRASIEWQATQQEQYEEIERRLASYKPMERATISLDEALGSLVSSSEGDTESGEQILDVIEVTDEYVIVKVTPALYRRWLTLS
ncbi:MAG: hypothetical protein KatS3mg038_2179 [Candidatus Kapaibacterium sp.]|nr:MAG: hypothetical protein KatS3mg038_2179 [Candidatus Kapabacteria bacterium]